MATEKKGTWGGRRRGAGRPALELGERQDAAVLVRMRPGEIEVLRQLAATAGISVGVYAREILRRRIRGKRGKGGSR